MISCQSPSDVKIRQLVSLVTQICLSGEFQTLKDELAKIYYENGSEDSDVEAFEDALYALLLQFAEQNSDVKELIATL